MSGAVDEEPSTGGVSAAWGLWLTGLALFAASLALFLIGIESAREIYFDETWYVPTARAWLKTGEMLRQEHPPLGKLLIALGMWIFGDNPLGWRAMSALFGAITIVASWLWGLALFRDTTRALWVAATAFFSAVVFVQARIAMLDIFLMAFTSLALAFFTFSVKEIYRPERAFRYALAMGACLGLAGACKWSGFFLALGLLAIRLLIGLMRLWKVRFADPRVEDFYSPEPSPAWTPAKTYLAFVVAPFAAYFVCYLPQMIHAGTISEFAASHRRMYEIMSGHSDTHPYMSLWYSWPAMLRPVWYLFEVPGHDSALWSTANPAAAIDGLANPVVVFAGEAAILWALARWIVRREMNAMIITVGFLSQYLPWAANPKGLEFFYYYFPSILCLSPALGLALFREGGLARNWPALSFLALAGAAFVYFLPILVAGIGVTPEAFAARMWFSTWR